jgi:hypothetical protein
LDTSDYISIGQNVESRIEELLNFWHIEIWFVENLKIMRNKSGTNTCFGRKKGGFKVQFKNEYIHGMKEPGGGLKCIL